MNRKEKRDRKNANHRKNEKYRGVVKTEKMIARRRRKTILEDVEF